jgi:hypothetical protein
MAVLIVPKDETSEYYSFLAITTRANGDTLIVDRRRSGRRRIEHAASVERRDPADRRGPAPATWARHRLIVTGETLSRSGRAAPDTHHG